MGEQISDGTVSGLALKHARSTADMTQADLAEAVDVSLHTVQGWESGRRPLSSVKAGVIADVRMELAAAGADGHALAGLDTAAHADALLRRILDPGELHVLGREVITRETCDALLWPTTGQPPRVLGARPGKPVLAAAAQQQIAGALREAAETARGPRAPMLRRQVGFLLAQDPQSKDYVRDLAAAEVRRYGRLDTWTPTWPVARGLAIAQAVAGDPEPLRSFLDHGLVTDETLAANLAYYAHWTGASTRHQSSDEFMADKRADWNAERLLASLVGSLHPTSPYLELTVRSVWSLLSARPSLVSDPVCCARVRARAEAVLQDAPELRASARAEFIEVVAAARRWG